MAENTVVKELLTDDMIAAGAQLTSELDRLGVPITAALWLFDSEVNEWRLLFASPEAVTGDPRKLYGTVQQALRKPGLKAAAVPMSIIHVVDPNQGVVRALRAVLATSPTGIAQIRFSKNVARGQYIDDALVYRAA